MATSANFVQLHNHTHYSLLDGASKIPDLVKRAKELGMPAVGITDHGNMHGAYEMWSAAVNAGIKPIIGIEAYVTPETARQDPTRVSWDTNWNPDLDPLHRRRNPDDVSGGGVITHLTMWAENDEGLVNLMKASTDANLEGRVMRYPRMDKEILAKYSKGIIASSGCPSGIIQTRLRLGQFEEALRADGESRVFVGIGTLALHLRDLAKSYKEAQIAIEVGKVFDTERYVINYENLGIGRLIYQLPTTLCEMFLQEVFKKNPIDALDQETLFTIYKFFENNLNVSETARKLFVHRNTLVYRLEKIKKLTGLDLREFDDAITFKVALMVKKYLTSRGIDA